MEKRENSVSILGEILLLARAFYFFGWNKERKELPWKESKLLLKHVPSLSPRNSYAGSKVDEKSEEQKFCTCVFQEMIILQLSIATEFMFFVL